MWGWVDRISGIVVDGSMSAAVWLGLIAMAMVFCRQPARRCSLARVGVVGALALVPLAWFRPCSRIDLAGPLRAIGPPSWRLSPVEAREPADREADSAPSPRAGSRLRRWSARLLVVGYFAGAVAGVAWLLLGWWGTAWLARRSAAPTRASLALYDSLTAGWMRGRPRLRVAPLVDRPVLLGLLRPMILFPAELDRSGAKDRLRLALLHELAHAQRHDPWYSLAGGLAQAVWFFLPQAWWVRTQMKLDHEFLTDHRAADMYGPFGSYAASLVDLASPYPPPARSPAATPARSRAFGAMGSALFMRIVMLVRCPFPIEKRPPLWWRLALPPIALTALLLTSRLTIADPHEADDARPRHGTFTLAQLNIDPPAPNAPAPGRPHEFLISLPPTFTLTLEVFARDEETLSQIRVVGHRLTPLKPLSEEAFDSNWHAVRVERGRQGTALWIHDLPARVLPEPGPASRWLSVQPPPRKGCRIRNLVLSW